MSPAVKIGAVGWFRRVGWLLLIWTASVMTLGIAAYAMRMLMAAAGLTAPGTG